MSYSLHITHLFCFGHRVQYNCLVYLDRSDFRLSTYSDSIHDFIHDFIATNMDLKMARSPARCRICHSRYLWTSFFLTLEEKWANTFGRCPSPFAGLCWTFLFKKNYVTIWPLLFIGKESIIFLRTKNSIIFIGSCKNETCLLCINI